MRQRIVDAAVILKQAKNPNDISMADVAEQAGVARVTVYRHFRDLDALKRACSRRFFGAHPPPDPSRWAAIANPHVRLREGLAEAHAYHRRTERMMAKIQVDGADAEVRASVPADRLLVYEMGSGWDPLCAFLGVPVPDEPYPSENSRAAFAQRAHTH